MTTVTKTEIKHKIVASLKSEKEIEKIILFGSFLTSKDPNDIDIAIFQNSGDNYLNLSLKYRKKIRNISKILPVDIIPLKSNCPPNSFLEEIETGEVVYER